MDPFPNAESLSLDYIRKVKAKLVDQEPETYRKFIQTLKEYARRNIPSSAVVETVNNLFRTDHPELLLDFQSFLPAAAAPSADEADSVDFMNRVEACFELDKNRDGYMKFLRLMDAYSKGEISVPDFRDKAIGIFEKNGHPALAAEFMSFLPESCRKITRWEYFKVEEELTHVDAQIGKLTWTRDRALELRRRLCDGGSLTAADARRFGDGVSFNCVRKLCGEIDVDINNVNNIEDQNIIICSVLPQLIQLLEKKIQALTESRSGHVSKMEQYLNVIDF
ncbi:hypothetical protein ACP275_13G016000 [Erythranthe tilingii]